MRFGETHWAKISSCHDNTNKFVPSSEADSFACFSRANVSHPYTLWRDCFKALLPYVRSHCRPHYLAALGPLLAIEASLFDCLGRRLWATYTHTSHKVKAHFLFDPNGLPEKWC